MGNWKCTQPLSVSWLRVRSVCFAQALQKEAAYFRDHPAYRGLDKRVGTTNLSKTLNQVRTDHLLAAPHAIREPGWCIAPVKGIVLLMEISMYV